MIKHPSLPRTVLFYICLCIYMFIYIINSFQFHCQNILVWRISCTITIPMGLILFVYFFLGPHLQHMEVPRLGVESELQLLAYTTAMATPVPSDICNLRHSLWPHRILKTLSEPGIDPASSQTLCWVLNLLSHNGNSSVPLSQPNGCEVASHHCFDLCFPNDKLYHVYSLSERGGRICPGKLFQ